MTLDDLIPKKEVFHLIASKLGVGYPYVRDSISKRADFPKPTRQAGKAAVYARQDIEKWLGVK